MDCSIDWNNHISAAKIPCYKIRSKDDLQTSESRKSWPIWRLLSDIPLEGLTKTTWYPAVLQDTLTLYKLACPASQFGFRLTEVGAVGQVLQEGYDPSRTRAITPLPSHVRWYKGSMGLKQDGGMPEDVTWDYRTGGYSGVCVSLHK